MAPALDTLNLYTPPGLAAAFFVTLVYSVLRPTSPHICKRFYRRRNLLICTNFAITTIFCVSAGHQLRQRANFSENALVHALSQILFFTTLSLTLLTIPTTPPVIFLVAWIASLIVEIVLLGFSVKQDTDDEWSIACSATICVLLLGLVLFTGVAFLYPQETGNAEEREPILGKSSRSSMSSRRSDYSADTRAEDGTTMDEDDGSDDSDDDDDEEEIKMALDQKIMEGGWIAYLASFKVFLPFLIPFGDRKLQFNAFILVLNTIAQRGAHVLHPYLLGSVIDILTKQHTVPWTRIFLWVFVNGLSGDHFGLEGINVVLLERLSAFTRRKVTVHAFDKIMGLSMDFHDRKDSGETIKAIEQAGSIGELFKVVLFEFIPCFFDVAVALWYVNYLLDAYGMLIIVAVCIGFVFTTISISGPSAASRRIESASDRKMTTVLFETISNWSIVSSFNRRAYETSRIDGSAKAVADSSVRNNDMYTAMFACQEASERLGLVAVSMLAAYRISKGVSTIGDFVAIESYWFTITMPLYIVATSYRTLSSNLIDTERLLQLLSTKVTVEDRPDASPLKIGAGEIEISNVSFAYEGQPKNVLNNLSLSIKAGQSVALVGSSGAGKSTITKLLMRAYDVHSGSIRINGQDIRDVTQESLRNNFGLVPQESVLFNTTVLENVRYGLLEATDEEIHAACKAASIHDKIMSLPHGYHSRVGEKGAKLSGGERQRIAIARVLLRNPAIVLLDEATSALDSQTETKVQQALKTLMKGRTACVIAHRLSTITDVDVIFVVGDGAILESGSHAELLEARGAYYELWNKQSAGIGATEAKDE